MADSELHVARASSVMALGTALSRITGFMRSILLVATLGTGILGDTYNVGNTMPNIIYNLLIGGSMTAVFVPQIVRAFRNKDGGEKIYLRSCFVYFLNLDFDYCSFYGPHSILGFALRSNF